MHNALATSTVKMPCTGQGLGTDFLSISEQLSKTAVLSLYKEVSLYPKPGLVSPVDTGSHKDMDYRMFLASINSLRDYFGRVSDAGSYGEAFATLRELGIEAEARMMKATKGVNTHRGAIFNLGLLCAAAGYLVKHCKKITPEALGMTIYEQWGEDILESGNVKAYAEYSHGQKVAARYGVYGARHEAVAGFPAATNIGLPVYRTTLTKVGSKEAAAVQALFSIMAHLDDTNILWRAGEEGLRHVKRLSSEFLKSGGVYAMGWKEAAIGIHHDFVQRNVSPGGAADLLGVTLFLNSICE